MIITSQTIAFILKIQNYMKISAHITGGGFIENIPRVINENLDAIINYGSWKINPIFNLIQKYGKISDQEMFNVFNMGIGLIVVSTEENSEKIMGNSEENSDPTPLGPVLGVFGLQQLVGPVLVVLGLQQLGVYDPRS